MHFYHYPFKVENFKPIVKHQLSNTTDICYDGNMVKKFKIQDSKFKNTTQKSKLLNFFLLLLTFTLLLLTSSSKTHAAQFSEVFLRLDRIKTSSPLSGTLCAKPSLASAGVENKVSITFPQDFIINTTASNWTVTTTNLSSGATAWPGTGTTSSVSGQTVTFPSNDLTSSTALYCFNFSSTSSQTSSTAGQKNGTVATKTSSDSIIDTDNYTVSIVNDDQIRITATVGATANDVQVDLSSLTTASEFSQDSLIEYEVTYGSYLRNTTGLTVEAEWKQGIIEGSGAPSIDIVDYVYGSTGNAINGIAPVVDLVNKKIRWTIPNFPGNTTDKKVRFALKTNSAYTGPSKVNFSVVARIIGPGFVTPDKVITKSYKYSPSQTTSTSTSTTTSTSQTTTPTTPAVTVYPPGNIPPTVFRNIFIPIISQNDAKIFIQTYGKYFHSVRYGQTPTRLTDRITSLNKTDKVVLDLIDLTPDTTYYFKAEVKDDSGKVTGTETFTFRTAEISDKPEVEKSTFLVTSQGNIIFNPIQSASVDGTDQQPIIVVPKETSYEIRFALKKGQNAKRVQAIVRNKNVLGISTVYAEEPNTEAVDMVEVEPGVYSGSLKSKSESGYYEQFVRIEDDKGNVVEEKVADIKVLKQLTILSKKDNSPIESARVLLSIYNPRTKTYETIGPNVIPIKNPSYSDSKGEVELVLPQGKYQLLVSNLGYKEQTVEFSIGPNPEDGFPTVYLEKEPFNLLHVAHYYGRAIHDVFLLNTKAYMENLSTSFRFFNLIAAVSFGSLVLLTLLSFSLRTHIPLIHLPRYLMFHLKKILPGGFASMHIQGVVVNEALHSPITQADVYIINSDKKIIVHQTSTNKAGEFFSDSLPQRHCTVAVMKKGYEPSEVNYPLPDGVPQQFTISLRRNEDLRQSMREMVFWAAENAVGFSFELLLIASIVFEVLFAYTFGWGKILPFFAVSFLNLILWLLNLHHLLRRA